MSGAEVIERGEVLWTPSPARQAATRLAAFDAWVRARHDVTGEGYEGLWRWSVEHPDRFWTAVLDHFDVPADGDRTVVVEGRMPTARWFPGLQLNYAEALLGAVGDDAHAVTSVDEGGDRAVTTGTELRRQVAAAAGGLRALGVGPGDRVAAYLPNRPEAIVAMLGAASLGAVWSCCAPDFGAGATLDRLAQIDPTVLIAVDGYRFGGRDFDRRAVVDEVRAGLPGLRATVGLGEVGDLGWDDLLATGEPTPPERMPFSHPLWIVYTSGTTGPPKAIVQGHGGILLEHLKALGLHYDLDAGHRFFQHTSTGWVMWNLLVGVLTTGAEIVTYDGSPTHPDPDRLWQLCDELEVTDFAAGAVFLVDNMKRDVTPGRSFDLSRLRSLGSTGAALPAEAYRWVYDAVATDLYLRSNSGGTDVCSSLLGGVPVLPVRSGELQGPPLGVDVAVFDDDGRSVVGREGELVVLAPMPSMPLYIWGDDDGSRYRDAYFDRFEGVWRHGDWACIFEDGGSLVLGRSDATLNRGGVRIGTAELYRVLEDVPGLLDSVVVDIGASAAGRGLVLFAVAAPDADPDALEPELRSQLRLRASPRHVPDVVVWCEGLPRTLNGKRVEVPIKRVLLGATPEQAVDLGTLRDPDRLAELPKRYAEATAET